MTNFTKEELEMRANKMSFLLGLCTGSLTELIGDESIPAFQKQKLKDLLSRIYPYIDELYYKDKAIDGVPYRSVNPKVCSACGHIHNESPCINEIPKVIIDEYLQSKCSHQWFIQQCNICGARKDLE